MTSLETTLDEFLHANRLLAGGERLLLAVSGGVDSMTMLELFCRLQKKWRLSLAIAHVNHQLRGSESDGDEQFVRAAAAQQKIQFFVTVVATESFAHEHGLSKQVAARVLRYRFLKETRVRFQAAAIATAHQANDNAETVLMNSLRGTGVRGLAGIPLRDDSRRLIRPMLFCSRAAITEFASLNRVEFREDSSNALSIYRRNYLRNEILPQLEERFDRNVVSTLNAVATSFRTLKAETDSRVANLFPTLITTGNTGTYFLDIASFHRQSEFLQAEIVLELFRRIEIDSSAGKVHAVLALTKRQSGRTLDLSKHWRAVANRGTIAILPSVAEQVYCETLTVGQSVSGASFNVAVSTPMNRVGLQAAYSADSVLVDAAKLSQTLRIRPWKSGDSFIPLGMQHRKKVSDFFIDNKIPVWKKHNIPLLESGNDIVWVCGLRLDDRFKISPATSSVVKLSYHNYVL